MHKSRVLFVPLVLIGVAGATRAAEAATVVRNVSTVAQLYSEFAAADNDPNNLHEIHLAAGTYRLICPTSGDSLTTRGSLKLNKGNVLLIGAGNDLMNASGYVIDGGWGATRCSSIVTMRQPNASPTVPTLEVRGVYMQNSANIATAGSAIDIRAGRLYFNYSRLLHVTADATGGAGISGVQATISIRRSMIDGAVMEDYGSGICGTGVFSWGGALYLSASSGTISESTLIGGYACRGGGIAFSSSASTDLLAITNSTIAFNGADVSGGGIYATGPGKVTLLSNTIANNSAASGSVGSDQHVARFGGGVAFDGLTGKLTATGNIIAENSVTNPLKSDATTPIQDAYDCFFDKTSFTVTASNNLVGRQGNCTFFPLGRLVGRINARVNPRLDMFDIVPTVWPGLVGMYSGLMPGSVAIKGNAGTCEIEDERGTLRAPTACDLGAYQTACAHDPCVTGAKLSTTCGYCVDAICGVDAHCCSSTWDSTCVSKISTVCGQSCQ